jgi:hypothetical protein
METGTELPAVELATKDWALRHNNDTERRIEKAFHEQTIFLSTKNEDLKREIYTSTRWLVGLIITSNIALIAAVLFKS